MDSPCNNFDDHFLGIVQQQKSIVSFLDSVFGFLYRCTDFYQLHDASSSSVGFSAGVAHDLVNKLYSRYEQQARYDEKALVLKNMATSEDDVPPAEEEVIITSDLSEVAISKYEKYDNYNGDDRGAYRWSQTLQDADVMIVVPAEILKAKQLVVNIEPTRLKVETNHDGVKNVLLEKTFPFKILKNESIWSLVPGEYVQVNLEKNEHRWWDCLFTGDPPINVKTLDTAVSTSELSQEDHMKIEELIAGQDKRQSVSTIPNVI